jgi:hypothetical protein
MRSSHTSRKTSNGLLRIGGQEERRRSHYIELSARRCNGLAIAPERSFGDRSALEVLEIPKAQRDA